MSSDWDYLALPVLLMTIEPGEDERTDFTGIFGAGTNDFHNQTGR